MHHNATHTVPLFGNCKQKKITSTEMATPESSAADNTSKYPYARQHRTHPRLKGKNPERTVVLGPPRKVAPSNNILEDEPDDAE